MLGVSVMFRRSLPALAITIAAIACLGQLALLSEPTTSLVAVPILIYSIARWTTGRHRPDHPLARHRRIGARAVALVAQPTASRAATASTALAMIMACVAGVAALYVLGRRRRETQENSQQRKQSEAERERLMLAEQQQRERSVTVEERTRIARELHDIVAHSLSVIVVQAEGGRALAAKHPEQAGEVLGTIAETSREALEEMRRMVLLLRSGGPEPEHAAYVPTPGLADIPELVRKTSETGPAQHVRADAAGEPGSGPERVPDRPGVADQRAQARRPGRSRPGHRRLHPGSIELEISDDGRGAAAGPTASATACRGCGSGSPCTAGP